MDHVQRISASLCSRNSLQCLRAAAASASSSASSTLAHSTTTTTMMTTTQRRGVASFRRTQKVLRVQPHQSFKASGKPDAQDHIVFNPPSSAPNVYHTPLKFLPPNDPRRKLRSSSSFSPLSTPSSSSSSSSSSQPASTSTSSNKTTLPPPVRPLHEKQYHLTPKEVEEIRRLRKEDPRQWTRVRLAQKFNCSQFFVSLCCSAPEIAEERKQQLDDIKSRWGRAKHEAREDRQKRKELWGRE